MKWDEANLYLNEGQMGGKMKIDEPKTPFQRNYDPAEDESEMSALDAKDLNVDELDMERAGSETGLPKAKPESRKRESEIPDLEIGEPEMEPASAANGPGEPSIARRESEGERRATIDADSMDIDGGRHGEEESEMTKDELKKHREFEQMRKKHYEMKNIKNLLGYVRLPGIVSLSGC